MGCERLGPTMSDIPQGAAFVGFAPFEFPPDGYASTTDAFIAGFEWRNISAAVERVQDEVLRFTVHTYNAPCLTAMLRYYRREHEVEDCGDGCWSFLTIQPAYVVPRLTLVPDLEGED